MKKWMLASCILLVATMVTAQDINILLKEADNFEKQQKEADALAKYKQVLLTDPNQLKSLVKCTELNVMLGNLAADKNTKRLYYESALAFANRAFQSDSSQADACYALAMASGKMTDVETENKKIVGYVRDVNYYSEKALAINPNHAKANYTMGKWQYEMANLSGIKKIAVKLFYGGLPEGTLDKAIVYMEKCKALAPYFVNNYLDLAKAYKENHRPAQAIEVLTKLVRLPTRTSEDIPLKAEGTKLLASLE